MVRKEPSRMGTEGQKPQGKRVPRRRFSIRHLRIKNEDMILACAELKLHREEEVRIPALWIGSKLSDPNATNEERDRIAAILGASVKIYEGRIHQLDREETEWGNYAAPFTALWWPEIWKIKQARKAKSALQDLVIDFVSENPVIKDCFGRPAACFPSVEGMRQATIDEIVEAIRIAEPVRAKQLKANNVSKALASQWKSEERIQRIARLAWFSETAEKLRIKEAKLTKVPPLNPDTVKKHDLPQVPP